jgi:hypothetical protein
MFKKSLAIAALIALPSFASAVTVDAINDYGTALPNVDATKSLDLPGNWTSAPLVVNPDASVSGQ